MGLRRGAAATSEPIEELIIFVMALPVVVFLRGAFL
jgi:hypothetical protein